MFVDDQGNPISDVRKPWKNACLIAGVPGLMFRDLTRTATRNMLRAGFSENVVRETAGLKTSSLLLRCITIEPKDIIAAGQLLQRYFDEERQPEFEHPNRATKLTQHKRLESLV